MSSISILVPWLGSTKAFEATLASVLRYRLPKHQVIVMHGPSNSETYGLSDEVDFRLCQGPPSLIHFFNCGLEAAGGEIINFLRPGIEVTENWFLYGVRALQERFVASAMPQIVDVGDRNKTLALGVSVSIGMNRHIACHAGRRVLGPCSWAAFYRRSVLRLVGPVDESLGDEFLDVDLALALRRLGLRTAQAAGSVCVANERLLNDRKSCRQMGRDAQRMIRRYGSSPDRSTALRTISAMTEDIMRSLVQPSSLIGLAGRFSAKSKQATDRAVIRRLGLLQHELGELGLDSGLRATEANRRAA